MTMLLIFLITLGFFSVVMMVTFTISEIQNIRMKNKARDEFIKRGGVALEDNKQSD